MLILSNKRSAVLLYLISYSCCTVFFLWAFLADAKSEEADDNYDKEDDSDNKGDLCVFIEGHADKNE